MSKFIFSQLEKINIKIKIKTYQCKKLILQNYRNFNVYFKFCKDKTFQIKLNKF